jgi:hypothetical protein
MFKDIIRDLIDDLTAVYNLFKIILTHLPINEQVESWIAEKCSVHTLSDSVMEFSVMSLINF